MPGQRERLQHQANDRLDPGALSRTRLPPVPSVKCDLPPVKLGAEFINSGKQLGWLSTVAPSAPSFFEHRWRFGAANCNKKTTSGPMLRHGLDRGTSLHWALPCRVRGGQFETRWLTVARGAVRRCDAYRNISNMNWQSRIFWQRSKKIKKPAI